MAFRIFKRLADLLDVDTTAAGDGDALVYDSGTETWIPGAGGGGGGAPTDVNYLVGTADAGLSAEIVVGTTPGGELGGTWASPTVDTTHSGSSHATVQAAAEATAAAALSSHASDTTGIHGIADTSALVLTGDSRLSDARTPTGSAGGVLGGTYPNPSFASDMATQAELDAHVNDTSAAHAASAVSADSTTLVGIGTDVQAVLEELDNGIADHIADSSAAHAASAISFSPTGNLAATDAQAAIAEAATDAASALSTHESDTTSVHGITDTSALALTANVVTKALFDANTVLAANSDDTPAALTMGASTILARLAAGNIKAASVSEIVALLSAYTAGGTDVALADGGTGASLSDPNADRIMFWDDSAGAVTWLTPGTGLTITSTTIDASGGSTDGWTVASDTWTYASSTTFTIAGVDRTALFRPGTRIKLTQTTAKYFVVVSSTFSTNTTVTVTGGSDYSLANASITSPFYSYEANPQGYPGWFNFGGGSIVGWGTPSVNLYRFAVVDRTCHVSLNISGTSNSTSTSCSLPIAALSADTMICPCKYQNNGAQSTTPGLASIDATGVVSFYTSWTSSAWASSNAKQVRANFSYEI